MSCRYKNKGIETDIEYRHSARHRCIDTQTDRYMGTSC